MRSLGTIRARVERLIGPPAPETLLLSWQEGDKRCPACAIDLKAHARETALAAAIARQAPSDPPPAIVSYATDDLATCPRCRAPLT